MAERSGELGSGYWVWEASWGGRVRTGLPGLCAGQQPNGGNYPVASGSTVLLSPYVRARRELGSRY